MIRYNLYLDEEAIARVNKLAEQKETSASALVREAIDTFLHHHECSMPMAVPKGQ